MAKSSDTWFAGRVDSARLRRRDMAELSLLQNYITGYTTRKRIANFILSLLILCGILLPFVHGRISRWVLGARRHIWKPSEEKHFSDGILY